MRLMLLLLLTSALLVGCKHPKSSSAPAAAAKTPSEKKTSKASTPRDASAPAKVTPINEPAGKVESVNQGLRFVVIDFGPSPVPRTEQRLGIYRDGQKVGEVKISSEARNSIVAADITAGEAKAGDEVRPQQ